MLNIPRLTDSDLAATFHTARQRGSAKRPKDKDTPQFTAKAGTTGEGVSIFLGLIDILQIYGARKQLEHHIKAVRYYTNKEGISVTDPGSYASRMTSFVLSKVVPTTGATIVEGDEDEATSLPATPARGARGPAPWEEPALSGLVAKKSTSFPFGWQPRWCEVYASSPTLLYYHSQSDRTRGYPPKGRRLITSVRRPDDVSSYGGVVLMLTTEPPTPKEKAKPLLLRFGSAQECALWNDTLALMVNPDGEPPLPVSSAL